jgi:hypothetical protein
MGGGFSYKIFFATALSPEPINIYFLKKMPSDQPLIRNSKQSYAIFVQLLGSSSTNAAKFATDLIDID